MPNKFGPRFLFSFVVVSLKLVTCFCPSVAMKFRFRMVSFLGLARYNVSGDLPIQTLENCDSHGRVRALKTVITSFLCMRHVCGPKFKIHYSLRISYFIAVGTKN